MANKTVSFRLPDELIDASEAQATAMGQSRTNVVIAALAQFYGFPHILPQSISLEQLQQQMNGLKHQIAILSGSSHWNLD